MLTTKQRKLIMEGFAKGVPDTLIAEMMPGLSQMQVYNFRRSLGIAASTVLDNRYNTWIRMLNSGVGLDVISKIYRVKPESMQVVLWRKKSFSFVESKKIAQEARDAQFSGTLKKEHKGIFDW